MRQFVRHDTHHLAFGRRRVEHAAVNEHGSTGKGEGVDLLQVERRKRILIDRVVELGWSHGHQPIAEPRQIAGNPFVLDDWILLPNFGGRLAAKIDVLLRGVTVFGQLDDGLCEGAGGCQPEGRQECDGPGRQSSDRHTAKYEKSARPIARRIA